MHYIDTLKQELSGTKAYEQTFEKEKSVFNYHIFHNATRFAVSAKLHKKPYKARFIANSSSCTTTELSKLLTSCLTTIKIYVIKYCEKVYEKSGKNLFWSIKNSCEVLNKPKSGGFRASSLSTYDFSTLYTTLPHNLIKDKLVDLIERTFQREGSLYIEVLVNRLGGLSLPRKSVVRLTDRPDMTLDVYRGRKTTIQQQQQQSLSVSVQPGAFEP